MSSEWHDEIIVGDLSTRRDFCDVRDVVRAYRLLAERGVSGEIYNIASGRRRLAARHRQRTRVAKSRRTCDLVQDQELLRPAEMPVLRGSYRETSSANGMGTVDSSWRQSLRDVIADMRNRRSQQ